MPEMLLKISQLAIFPWKCLALPCCSISPPSFHRKLKLAFGCWKSVCCSFRLLKERLLISVLKRIVSVNEFLPLSLKVKGSKRYNELKRFCGQISAWKSFDSMQLTQSFQGYLKSWPGVISSGSSTLQSQQLSIIFSLFRFFWTKQIF